ncbi:MAG: GGDEF domain-containing protein, partial [candidate division KSB1 bacterium]|nr:GGDEF domain-containing protein [candidate division KSB1 bacterium]
MNLGQTIDALRGFFVSRFQVERFAFYLRDEDSDHLVLRNSYRLPGEAGAGVRLTVEPWLRKAWTNGSLYVRKVQPEEGPVARLIGGGTSVLLLGLKGVDGKPIGLVALGKRAEQDFSRRDVVLLRKLGSQIGPMVAAMLNFERTKELSFTDPLTGVHNRRYFNQVYVREFERARRYGRPLSVLMIDIDHFKVYNDTLGHLAGDGLLRR